MRSILFALLMIGFTAQAHAAQECMTPDMVAQEILKSDSSIKVSLLEGPKAQSLAEGLSKLVGQDVPSDSTFILAPIPNTPLVTVVQFENGCAAHHGRFLDKVIQALIDGPAA